METSNAATSGPTRLTVWRRDYRLSLALLAAGVILLVGLVLFEIWAGSTGNYPTSFGAGLALDLIGTAGFWLIIFAGTVAYYHRLGLRQSRREV